MKSIANNRALTRNSTRNSQQSENRREEISQSGTPLAAVKLFITTSLHHRNTLVGRVNILSVSSFSFARRSSYRATIRTETRPAALQPQTNLLSQTSETTSIGDGQRNEQRLFSFTSLSASCPQVIFFFLDFFHSCNMCCVDR